ncbi:MAG: aminopeptidase P N-terminal domain-containing protein [Desulfuromonadales bacterium]|nr:aminopeptidase P N-terminal domain-containing protein [Desulfuromonadales bacterium]MBN2791493.1 aminopeptidase P N-terminal domain-containing protein [Desulfuromonadales bacterium]
MFAKAIYQRRRYQLFKQLDSGVIVLLGNSDSPFNSKDNCYRFRQDSSFLYFCGIDQPGYAALLDIDSGEEILFGPKQDLDDLIWSGPGPALSDQADAAGFELSEPFTRLEEKLSQAQGRARRIHYLPSCRTDNYRLLAQLLGTGPEAIQGQVSRPLIKAVVALRSVKEAEEINELDEAADLGFQLHSAAMRMAQAGVYEWQIAGELEALAARAGRMLSFPSIVTVQGQILHNHQRHHCLKNGDLLLVDAGVESARHYASDHTRTWPVGGQFNSQQREIYQIVLAGLERARQLIRPGVLYRDIHLEVCYVIASGLKNLGLMQGDVTAAVAAGAHALFMPHGLGHMLGLDVHDMEELGEDAVGYDETMTRSNQFGLARLRLARRLKEGFALTVEPGIYFIPGLIEKWRETALHPSFINYRQVDKYRDLGGIRLEDDVLVTAQGNRLLGQQIPLSPEEVENLMLREEN